MRKLLGVLIVAVLALGAQRSALRSFTKVVHLETASEDSANVSMGDLDGDGDLDLVLAKGRHTPILDRVLLNDGKGGSGTRGSCLQTGRTHAKAGRIRGRRDPVFHEHIERREHLAALERLMR